MDIVVIGHGSSDAVTTYNGVRLVNNGIKVLKGMGLAHQALKKNASSDTVRTTAPT